MNDIRFKSIKYQYGFIQIKTSKIQPNQIVNEQIGWQLALVFQFNE